MQIVRIIALLSKNMGSWLFSVVPVKTYAFSRKKGQYFPLLLMMHQSENGDFIQQDRKTEFIINPSTLVFMKGGGKHEI